jgi:hypothetical protein
MAVHPQDGGISRPLLQGQAEQDTLDQFYQLEAGDQEGSPRPVSAASTESDTSVRRPVSARSNASSNSSMVSIPKNSRSVQAVRAEYERDRSLLNRSSTARFDYSSDEFLGLQTDEEIEGNEVLYKIAQETKNLSASASDSLTSFSILSIETEVENTLRASSLSKDDIMECVMTKRTMFSSVQSYYDFTDVLYEEMVPLVQDRNLVQILMDTLSTEQDMNMFQQEFFQQVIQRFQISKRLNVPIPILS